MSNRSIFKDKIILGPIDRTAARVVKQKQGKRIAKTSEKSHLCRLCGASFSTHSELVVHTTKNHSGSVAIVNAMTPEQYVSARSRRNQKRT